MSETDNQYWRDKSVTVTGGSGFLGRHVVAEISKYSPKEIKIPRSVECDLREYAACLDAFRSSNIVIHLAANAGGIGYNLLYPADLYDDNILMGTNCLRAARAVGAEKFVGVGTICAYPKNTPVPFKEEALWDGYPEETNAAYGLAKKMLLVQSQAYRQQYGYNAIHLMPVNLYGPYDHFDSKEKGHVIPDLITRMVRAEELDDPEVEIYGSGNVTREFLYVEDAAEGIVMACERYDGSEPINLGSGVEMSIKELAQSIKDEVGFQGQLRFNKDKPDGQPKRGLDTTKAFINFGFQARTNFSDGLRKTVAWYKANRSA